MHASFPHERQNRVGAEEPPEAVGFSENGLRVGAEVPERVEGGRREPEGREDGRERDAAERRLYRLPRPPAPRKPDAAYENVRDYNENAEKDGLEDGRRELLGDAAEERRFSRRGEKQERDGERERERARAARAGAQAVERREYRENPQDHPVGRNGVVEGSKGVETHAGS